MTRIGFALLLISIGSSACSSHRQRDIVRDEGREFTNPDGSFFVISSPWKPEKSGNIGVRLRKSTSSYVVQEVFEESPAAKAGIAPLDEITAIDGKAAISLSPRDAVEAIRGVPGTSVSIEVRSRSGGDNRTILITREKLRSPPVPPDGGISLKRMTLKALGELDCPKVFEGCNLLHSHESECVFTCRKS